jgi:hypothetical protein
MNPFLFHHQDLIRFHYSCFDRILLNVCVQLLQIPVNVVCFFRDQRQQAVDRNTFRAVSRQYHDWVTRYAQEQHIPLVRPEDFTDDRRENWTEGFFQQRQGQPGIGVILKSRESARIAVAEGQHGKPHIDLTNRFVEQYYFYLDDPQFGRAFFRICPYFPHNSRLCINGHEWLARQLTQEGIPYQKCGNAFLECAAPARLQELADQFSHEHIIPFAHRWLAQLVPTFTAAELRRQGYGFRLFVSQAEYCHNTIFHERAALDRLHERLLDHNRTIGRPDRLAYIFGRRFTEKTVAGIQTKITDYAECNPVIRSEFKSTSIKQYVRDHCLLRDEATTNYTPNLGVNKGVENLPQLRQVLQRSTERYQEVQQDVLETFVDRGQLQALQEATVSPAGRRTPGLKLTDRRLLAVMGALVGFRFLAGVGTFRTKDLLPEVVPLLTGMPAMYGLGQLRYDLGKLLAKGLVLKVAGTQTYQLTPTGFRLCLLYLKLFHKIYTPLTAGTMAPEAGDARLPTDQRCTLDRLYVALDQALQALWEHMGIRIAG